MERSQHRWTKVTFGRTLCICRASAGRRIGKLLTITVISLADIRLLYCSVLSHCWLGSRTSKLGGYWQQAVLCTELVQAEQ